MTNRLNYRSKEENITSRREKENLRKKSKDKRTNKIKIIIEFLILKFFFRNF
jgi:hypothetical protein